VFASGPFRVAATSLGAEIFADGFGARDAKLQASSSRQVCDVLIKKGSNSVTDLPPLIAEEERSLPKSQDAKRLRWPAAAHIRSQYWAVSCNYRTDFLDSPSARATE
jgi:hypothetical protein